MGTIKVSELTAKTSPSGSEELLINDGGVSKKITIANLPDNDTTYSVGDGGLTEINFTSADNTKLDGIETGATADQTGAEIKTAYELEANTNAYTDAEQTKLAGIETGATADQSNSEIKTAYEANADTNAFTDADHSKLDGIEASADVTDTANVTAAGALMDSEVTNLAQVKAFDSTAYATAAHNHSGVYEPADATIVKDADIGSTVQAYDADTAKTDVAQTFTISQRGTLTTDNDGSFDMNATNNFKCTPTGNFTLTFTNIVSQSGFILLVNTGGHTVSAAATTKVDANALATISTAGTYLVSYFSDGSNVYLTNSLAYT